MGGDALSRRKTILAFIAVLGIAVFLPGHSVAQEKSIVVASTTSTQDSGLFGHLLPLFTGKTGVTVKVLSQGTGQALDSGRRGNADVVFMHAKSAEQKFLAEGQGVKRFPVMYNDFVLIGPKSDPAGIKGMKDVAQAFKTIKDKQATFISRGDHSGPIWPNSRSGTRTPASTSKMTMVPGTNRSAGEWSRRSIWRAPKAAMCCPIAAPGSTSRTRATCKFWWKATSACSTSMA